MKEKAYFIVSTDSSEILSECSDIVDLVDMRPPSLGEDFISIEEVLKYTAEKYAKDFEYGLYLALAIFQDLKT